MELLGLKTQPQYFLTGILALLFIFSGCSKDSQKADRSLQAFNHAQPRPASPAFHFLKGTWFFESQDADSVTCINGSSGASVLKKRLWESLLKVFGSSQELVSLQEKDRLRFDFVEGNRVKISIVQVDGNKQEQGNWPLSYVAGKKAFQSLQFPPQEIEFEDADPSYRILILPEDTGICTKGGKIKLKLKWDDQHRLAIKIDEFKKLKEDYLNAQSKESVEGKDESFSWSDYFNQEAVKPNNTGYGSEEPDSEIMRSVRACHAEIVVLIKAICPGVSPPPTFDVDTCAYPLNVPQPDPL